MAPSHQCRLKNYKDYWNDGPPFPECEECEPGPHGARWIFSDNSVKYSKLSAEASDFVPGTPAPASNSYPAHNGTATNPFSSNTLARAPNPYRFQNRTARNPYTVNKYFSPRAPPRAPASNRNAPRSFSGYEAYINPINLNVRHVRCVSASPTKASLRTRNCGDKDVLAWLADIYNTPGSEDPPDPKSTELFPSLSKPVDKPKPVLDWSKVTKNLSP